MSKVALVTGGTGGLGNAICRRLADNGCTVATTYRNKEKAEEWQKACKADNYDFAIYQCDVGSFDECSELAKQVEADLGPVDVVVNNAGITRDTVLKKMDLKKWQQVINADLDSIFNVTRQFIEGMIWWDRCHCGKAIHW